MENTISALVDRTSAVSFFGLVARGLVLSGLVACAGCTLPKSAPVAANVEEAPDPADADYFVAPLIPQVVQVMGNRREVGFPAAFHLAGYRPSIALKPGDIISVTIYEVGAAPTFGAVPSNTNVAAAAVPAAPAPVVPPRMSWAVGARSYSALAKSQAADTPKTMARVRIASNDPGLLQLSQITPQQTPTTGGTAPSPTPPAPTAPPIAPTTPPVPRTLPPLVVESDGNILIPYAGHVSVIGQTPSQAAERIRNALVGKAMNPQVLVSFVSNGTNQATVGGEVNRPGPVILTLRGERLLDALGQAGGSKWPATDTDVDIIRGGEGARVKLQTIVDNPSENIRVRPNDQVFLTHNPRSFTVLGASQKPAQYTFDTPRVTLAEAVGRAGGAIDTVGNPAAVYLFREEPARIADKVLAISSSLRPAEPGQPLAPIDSSKVKLVYKLDMNSAEGYFVSRKIYMMDKDVVLIANAEGTQLLKAFTLVRGVTGAIGDLNVIRPASGR